MQDQMKMAKFWYTTLLRKHLCLLAVISIQKKNLCGAEQVNTVFRTQANGIQTIIHIGKDIKQNHLTIKQFVLNFNAKTNQVRKPARSEKEL